MKQIIYATTNPGKFAEVKGIYAHHGIKIKGLKDFGISNDVRETGTTLEENAALKSESYLKLLPSDTIVVSDDTGLEIDALDGEPGIHVRRWLGYRMSDEEIINYTLSRMKGIAAKDRGAQFHTVLAVSTLDKPTKFFHGIFRGSIMESPENERVEGMPFFPIFLVDELGISLDKFHRLPIEEQLKTPTHRERAVIATLPYLHSLIEAK